jgi:hypothetical protein
MTDRSLSDLVRSLDQRGIEVRVAPALHPTGGERPTQQDARAAKGHRAELVRVALARDYAARATELERAWAGYPDRRTPRLEGEILRLRREAAFLLPEGVPWELVAGRRGDGTVPSSPFEMEDAA